MKQTEVLRLIDENPSEAFVTLGWRGEYHLMIRNETIPYRVWGRLLDRGDLSIADDLTTATCKTLSITEQGRKRLAS